MREIVEKLRLIEAEQKRRRENPLARYNAGEKKHEKQLAFHQSKKRNRWVFGGNRSGKTECGAVECVYMAREFIPIAKIGRTCADGWFPFPNRSNVTSRRRKFYITFGRIGLRTSSCSAGVRTLPNTA